MPAITRFCIGSTRQPAEEKTTLAEWPVTSPTYRKPIIVFAHTSCCHETKANHFILYFQIKNRLSSKFPTKTFNALFKNYDPRIIVISTWRFSYSIEELKKIFITNKMKGTIIGKTTTNYIADATRGDEILLWLLENKKEPVLPMIILEDMACIDPFEALCVRPQPRIGLSMNDVPKGIKIIEKQLNR